MPELIDREKLLHELCGMCCAGDKYKCRNPWGECDEVTVIKKQPTIDPEVQLAHWIPGKRGKWKCSCCGNEIYCTSPDDLQRNHEFCGHCGAEMKDQCDMRTLIEEAIL